MTDKHTLIEGLDYYWEERDGMKFRVFTEHYLSKRGFCCQNNCRHCPYKNKRNKRTNGKDKSDTI